MATTAPSVLILSDDLIFTSRITGAARDYGASAQVVRNVDAAISAAQREPPSCVIVDLALIGGRMVELIGALASLPSRPRLIAYGSHVDTESLRSATEAGCDVVLPRSRFVEVLPRDLPQWLAPRAKA